jgi:hypothetical protein
MSNKIKAAAKDIYQKDGQYWITEENNGIERHLKIRFGTSFKTSNRIMFFYTEEKL